HRSTPSLLCNTPHTPTNYTLSLHDALPISQSGCRLHLLTPSRCARSRLIDRHLREHFHELAHDALDIGIDVFQGTGFFRDVEDRSEEHTSELQSRFDIVCRFLLEKKKMIRV